jgi:GntR family transcriptional regulator/MocR family aminotransferase
MHGHGGRARSRQGDGANPAPSPAGRRTRGRPEFPLDVLALDRASSDPLYRQLYDTLRRAILNRSLPSGFLLPPSRILARQLAVGRNTVVTAYEQLAAEGYAHARSGTGTWVADLPDATPPRPAASDSPPPSLSVRGARMSGITPYWTTPGKLAFHPGYPEIRSFPWQSWARLLADTGRRPGQDLFGYHCMGGLPELREAIATYLGASRGVVCRPEQVIVTAGAQAALDLVARLFLDEGDVAWMEEPGYAGARAALRNAGAVSLPLPVGSDGWRLADPERPPPRLIYVTPSCQMPRGIVMRMDERLRLLTLAEQSGAWIVEDDYDSEYRFQGRPAPAIQGLDRNGRVLYVGTFGKVLFPALRVGFVIVPSSLAAGVESALSTTGQVVPLPLQLALARFIAEGLFARHLKRMRRLYALRQKLFVAMFQRAVGHWLTLDDADGGMQLVARFRRDFDDRAVAALAFQRGLDIEPLSASFSGPPEPGLRLGYAGFDLGETTEGLARLRSVLQELQDQDEVRRIGPVLPSTSGSFEGTSPPLSSVGRTGRDRNREAGHVYRGR